jgi:hypothetical protein
MGGIHKKERYHLTFWVVFFFFFAREGIGIGTGRDGNGIYGLAKKRTCARDFFFGIRQAGIHIHRMHRERERVCERRKSYRLRCLFFCLLVFFFFWTFGFGWENWKGVGLGWVREWAWNGHGMGFRVLACLLAYIGDISRPLIFF